LQLVFYLQKTKFIILKLKKESIEVLFLIEDLKHANKV